MNPFGKMLRQERKEKGITLAEMADALGVSSPYLSQMETGAKAITPAIIEKVIRYFDFNASDADALRRAAARSTPQHVDSVTIRLSPDASARDRQLATSFALSFNRMKPDLKRQLQRMLEDTERG